MKKKDVRSIIVLVFTLCLVMCAAITFTYKAINVRTNKNPETGTGGNAAATLSIAINGGDGEVSVTVRNDVTVLPATVHVRVELYCSDEYTTDYENMELVNYATRNELSMGRSVTVTGETAGRERYWLGRARYKIGSGEWKTLNTGVCRISADGELIELG